MLGTVHLRVLSSCSMTISGDCSGERRSTVAAHTEMPGGTQPVIPIFTLYYCADGMPFVILPIPVTLILRFSLLEQNSAITLRSVMQRNRGFFACRRTDRLS